MASSSKLIKFDSQVAGHDNIMCLPSNDLMVFKPSNQQEREFYEASQQHEEFMDWIPECYGTLRSSTEHEKELLRQGQEVEQVQADRITNVPTDQLADLDEHLCLENILNGFTRPCIIDIKLGYKIYEDTADEAKRTKMIKNAQGTTIESLGLRISGMKIFDSVERYYTTYSKQYGRERTADNFVDGLLSYFYPTSLSSDNDNSTYSTRSKEEQVLENTITKPIGKKKIEWIVEHFIDTVTDIQGFIEEHAELHLVGCSLLLVYEGDAAAAQRAWKKMLDEDRQQDDYSSRNGENDDEGGDIEEVGPKLCDIRLIDFGRSRWQSGRAKQEPSFIKALDNLVALLNQVIEQAS